MYGLVYSESAKRELKKLPRPIQEQIIAKLERARIRPEHFFERLVGLDSYKLRVGQYRIIADILQDRLVILVIEVGHRRNIYKGR